MPDSQEGSPFRRKSIVHDVPKPSFSEEFEAPIQEEVAPNAIEALEPAFSSEPESAEPVSEIEPTSVPKQELVSEATLAPTEDFTIRRIEGVHSLFSRSDAEGILDYLVKFDLLTQLNADALREALDKDDRSLYDMLVEDQYLKEKDLGTAVASFYNCTYTSFKGVSVPVNVITLLPKQVSINSGVVVFDIVGDVLKVAMVNPKNVHFLHQLEKKTGKIADVHFTTPRQIQEALKSYPSEFEDRLDSLMARANANISHLDTLTNVSEVFDSLVLLAYQQGASDVHIEPFEKEIRIRFRIDGVLHIVTTLPTKFIETIINHIKVLAHLRIDTHNASQDGRFHVAYGDTTINFRVSLMPTHFGEKAVLRLLTSETQEWSLNELGYSATDQRVIEKSISKTNGMILVSGPTGSGKTTTLYAVLKGVNSDAINIATIEDPIEYGLPGIIQTQINPRTNITYAEGLKSLMRQDPDVLMIGEIRDFETGKIAVNAALTGHIVLSTVHTNNASLAPLRLLQMGVDPYLITTTVDLIIAQRLIRKLCQHCRASTVLDKKALEEITSRFALDEEQKKLFDQTFSAKEGKIRLFKGVGCDQCGNSGFHGRTVIAETLVMKDNIRELIMDNRSEADIEAMARKNGMITMLEDGLNKVKEGDTTLEEVFRVINQ